MLSRCFFTFLLSCSFLVLGVAQEKDTETDTKPTHSLYEAVVFPDRSLSRRLEQAARLFETGRSSEAAQLLGGLLESADSAFFPPDETAENPPARTLRQTVNDYIINRIRNLPREARESYAFQFEPTARRLLDNAVRTGSLDDVQQVARKYFPTPSGASATFLVALTQYERGDDAAAFLTLDRLKRLHPSIPDTLMPALEQMVEELQNGFKNTAEPSPQRISESAWLEQIGWRLPTGSPSQNSSTQATAPLLEQNWTVPIFSRLFHERETDALSQLLENGKVVYIPASQPLLVGDLLITRTFGETIAVDTNTGKRLWTVSEPEYRFPEGVNVPPLHTGYNLRTSLRLFFWHNRIAQQSSSDGERLFCIDGHDFQVDPRQFARIPNLAGKGEDLRFSPGNTLTARDRKTGRILWQAGKFPYVQKYIDALLAPSPQKQRQTQGEQVDVDETVFTDDEKTLKETWFLGAPLPLQGRLYVIGETDGVLHLFVLESSTGRLVAKQAFSHASSSITANFARRTYPLFPSASGGLLICPASNGLVAALDATTLSPVWCYTYAPIPAVNVANRRIQNQRMNNPTMNVSETSLQGLFAESGWQVPRIIIDGQRVLVAPPDRAALYCLDLLSGELLWEQTVSRPNALYVACVQNDKAFVVTPINLRVFDMNTGEDVTVRQSSFPSTLKPAGVGVHSGDQYFIPFTNGQLAIADLKEGHLTWLSASGAAISSSAAEVSAPKTSDEPPAMMGMPPAAMMGMGGVFGGLREEELEIFTPDLVADTLFQRPTRFGNLVRIRGWFFSQSPTLIARFDQKEPLRQQTEALLQANPNDPDGLLQQGRLLKSEGKLAEAIDFFRASLKSNPTPEATDALRRTLLEAMRNDYSAWADTGQELESLAEFSDEWNMILYAQIEGILQSGTADDLVPVLEKVFAFEQDSTILVPVSSDYSAQLHRALGGLIDQSIIRGNRPALRAAWEELAETFFQRLTENPAGFIKPSHISALPSQWVRNTVYLPPDLQRWSIFTHIFRNTRAAEKAKQLLRAEYERTRLPIALDLQEKPSAVPEWSELSVPFVWNSGIVDVQHVPVAVNNVSPTQDNAARSEIDNNLDRLLATARNPDASRLTGNQLKLPLLSSPGSELAAFDYVLTPWTMGATEFFLCCNDSSGQEQWRLALPGMRYQETRMVNTLAGEHALYVKRNQNILILVVGNSMTAIDVSSQPDVKIIWSKTLTEKILCQQSSTNRNPDQRLAANGAFPQNSVFVSPHVVAVWDAHCVYGLDPLTGQTLWVRNVLHDKCSLLGDDENLFLAFPDTWRVIAVDPAGGRELADGFLPYGTAYYVFGTNVVFATKHETSDDYALSVCDLRSLHNKRDRAVRIFKSLPSETLHDKLNHRTTLIQMLHGDRFLSVAHWGTKSLQIHDLQTKKKLLPHENNVLQFVSAGNTGTMRCDIEFVEDRILVLFTKELHIPQMRDPAQTADEPFRQMTYNQITNPCISINAGEMMLFDTAGNPCWSAPTKIETTFRLWDVPDRLPVMLFAVSVQTRETKDSVLSNKYTTRIMGVDKRTGESRFRKGVNPNGPPERPPLQSFQVTADPLTQEIIFTTPSYPPETVRFRFTEEK